MKDDNVVIDKIVNLFDDSINYFDRLTNSIINFYYFRYKYLNAELIEHDTKKPCKFFKKSYLKWLNEREKLEKEKKEILNKIKEEYQQIKTLN